MNAEVWEWWWCFQILLFWNVPTMSLVNYDLQNTVDNDTNSLYFSNSAAQLKQPSGVSKTAVSEHSITFSAVRYRLILEGSKEF